MNDLHQETIKEIGCTAPFYQPRENDHLNICTNSTKGEEAKRLLLYLLSKRADIKECPYPCTYLKSKIMSTVTSELPTTSSLGFTFNLFTKESIAYLTYTELELIAEFGGYVGLFLGYSVLSLTDVFKKIVHLSFQRF